MVGPNGAGKTNLLESLHIGTQGFSPRARSDAQVIRFGATAARIALRGERSGAAVDVEIAFAVREAKQARLNGVRLRAAEQLRTELATLVFTPDRLAIAKGGPAIRRAYFDRTLGRLSPAQGLLPAEYGAALAQRNAALRRIAAGISSVSALEPWTQQVAGLGERLVTARCEALKELQPGFAERAGELGLPAGALAYEGEPPSVDALDARRDRDLERGSTGAGPHLHDVQLLAGGRDLRSFGSQGEQRSAVLALLLAEAGVIEARQGLPPLLLLDDVLSELDPGRRRVLASQVTRHGQTVITSTTVEALPVEPAQLVSVSPGHAKAA